MDLLLKREQNRNWRGRVVFRLWAKAEMAEDERALIDRYNMDESCLLSDDDTGQLKWAIAIGLFIFSVIAAGSIADLRQPFEGIAVGAFLGVGAGYWYFNEKRETIWMRDLLYGRRFKCGSIIELAKKEAMLDSACIVVRQMLETAKHWDGVETRSVPVLPPDEAKEVVARL